MDPVRPSEKQAQKAVPLFDTEADITPAFLYNIIESELDKPEHGTDYDLISECIEFLKELEAEESSIAASAKKEDNMITASKTERKEMEEVLKKSLRTLALELREERKITQSTMADGLLMALRSYSDIEGGRSMCGTFTAICLILSAKDPLAYLEMLRAELEQVYQKRDPL